MDPSYPVFPVFAFLGFILVLVPLHWQLEAWNVGAVWFILWTALSCFIQYFNAIVWSGNTVNSAPAWCDISIRVMMAVSVGLPAASLCINRRLYYVVNVPPAALVGKQEKRRAVIIDSFICGLFPVLYTGLQIIVQRHRFDILEDIGCTIALYNSPPTYFISSAPPLLLSFGSAVYLSLSQRAFVAARATLTEGLSAHRNLTEMRFVRLGGLTFSVLFPTVALGLLTIATNVTAVLLSTQVSGDVAPFDFNVIAQVPRDLWAADSSNRYAVELTRWLGPACALAFFAFFGLAEEARTNYAHAFSNMSIAFWNAAARIGFTRALPPLPGAAPKTDNGLIQLASISRPIRPASGTGSFADFSRSSRFEPSRSIEPKKPIDTTFAAPSPTQSPPSATSGRSFVVLRRSSTDPEAYVLPPYRGWHHISEHEGEPEVLKDPHARIIQPSSPPVPVVNSGPRGRTLV
ncbi:pheromone A receptor-domain-containing protein [Mycena latifolia]|nr:pheromone A receptor-domain-containing protein [Mycena latifolia]